VGGVGRAVDFPYY